MSRSGVVLRVIAACLVGAAVGCSGGSRSPSPAASSTVVTPAGSLASTNPSSPEFLALWPETDRSVVPATIPRWRQSAPPTVAHFATAVLDWPHPIVRPARSRFRLDPGVHAFDVSRQIGTHVVEVHAARVGSTRAWSVTYLWGFGRGEPRGSVSITALSASIAFDYWDGAASAELRLTYASHTIKRASATRARWVVPVKFPINVNGAVIVVFRDRAGNVYTGWGTPLRAGPIAAG